MELFRNGIVVRRTQSAFVMLDDNKRPCNSYFKFILFFRYVMRAILQTLKPGLGGSGFDMVSS